MDSRPSPSSPSDHEARLERSQRRLQAALAAGAIGIFELDLTTGKLEVDPSFDALLGRPAGTITTVAEFCRYIHPEDANTIADQLVTVREAARFPTAAVRHLRPDGQVQWLSARAHVECDAAGHAVRLIGAAIDVTEQRRRERERRIDLATRRVLTEATTLPEAAGRFLAEVALPEGYEIGVLWVEDPLSHDLDAVAVRHQRPRHAGLATWLAATCPPRDGSPTRAAWSSGEATTVDLDGQRLRDRKAIEADLGLVTCIPLGHRDGTFALLELFRPPRDAYFDPTSSEAIEAAAQRIAQLAARQRAEETARRLLSLSPSCVYAMRIQDGRVQIDWLAGDVARLTGFGPDDVADHATWLARVHPDDRSRVIEAHADPSALDGLRLEYRVQHRDGRTIWIADEKTLVRDADGRATGLVLGTSADVTARIDLEAQLLQSQKMEAIGLLAGGVAHDFNNMLTVVSSSAVLLDELVEAEGEAKELLDEIRQATDRAAALTRQLLLFSRTEVRAAQVVAVDDVVRGIEPMIRRSIGEDVALSTVLAAPLGSVRIDPGQLEQILVNLAVNARDAMPRGGALVVETAVTDLDAAFCTRAPGLAPGTFVRLSVIDEGEGIPTEHLSRIFEPFFSTKPKHKGTGLGLSIVFGIVRQAKGHVAVTSEPGAGTRFDVFLPTLAATTARSSVRPSGVVEGAGERLLLVEDEVAVRRVARLALERAGYRVHVARDGVEALEYLSAHVGEVDLMITDVVMPTMSGVELGQHARALRPDLPVLFTSGYIDDALVRHGVEASEERFLHKPFTPITLTRKVREVLDARGPFAEE